MDFIHTPSTYTGHGHGTNPSKGARAHTTGNLGTTVNLICISLVCGRKLVYPDGKSMKTDAPEAGSNPLRWKCMPIKLTTELPIYFLGEIG